jgi:hypothetical protein
LRNASSRFLTAQRRNDVRFELFVNPSGVQLQRRIDSATGSALQVDFDQFRRIFRNVSVFSDDHREPFADVTDFFKSGIG